MITKIAQTYINLYIFKELMYFEDSEGLTFGYFVISMDNTEKNVFCFFFIFEL